MLSSLEIHGLRGIEAAKLEGLAPLTILVGPNGSGKSTILEASGIACAGLSIHAAFKALAAREWLGLAGMSFWLTGKPETKILARFDSRPFSYSRRDDAFACTIELSKSDASDVWMFPHAREVNEQGPVMGLASSIWIEGEDGYSTNAAVVNEDGVVIWTDTGDKPFFPFSLHSLFVDRPAGALRRLRDPLFSSALREAISAIKLSAWYDDFFSYLKVLRPELSSIESLAVGDRDEPFIFESQPRRGYPLAYAGDGFRRALLVAASLAQARGGIAAMDEPEAFSHPRMFPTLAHLIHRAVGDGTQVIFATHSLEFVEAALREFKDTPEKACVVGLKMDGGKIDPVTVSGPDAYTRVVEWKDDLRL